MRISSSGGGLAFLSALLILPATAGATFQGTVVDPSGAAIAGAQISAVNRLGVVGRTTTSDSGGFVLTLPQAAAARLMITAAGFETRTIPVNGAEQPLDIRLNLAPQVDAIRVVGSTLDVSMSEQGGSVSLIPREEIAQRNEALAVDLLRYLPGVAVAQNGAAGGAAGLFLRGGNYNFNLVQIDGVTINSFGGAFDFAHVPTSWLERVEVIRGPQSAVYGPYANSGVVNFVTRAPEDSPPLDLLAEAGTYHERRFSLGSAGSFHGLGVAAFAARMDSDGPVANSDYRNESVLLHGTRALGRHFLAFSGNFSRPRTELPVLTVPTRPACSPESIGSAATRTTSPATWPGTRATSRRVSGRKALPVSSWRTASMSVLMATAITRISGAAWSLEP